MKRLVAALVGAAVLLLAAPASAEDPVFDAEDTADVTAALAEATSVQGVCYGWVLRVSDVDTGRYSGTWGTPPGPSCPQGTVVLDARITYESTFSEAEDSADWTVESSIGGFDIADVEALGLSASDLLDDGKSALTLQNAVLSLPRLAAETTDLPPVVLEPNAEPLPPGAEPTGTPGSDWLRENGALLLLCVAAIAGGVMALFASRRPDPRRGRGPRFTSFGPTPPGPPPGSSLLRPTAPHPPTSGGPNPWSDR